MILHPTLEAARLTLLANRIDAEGPGATLTFYNADPDTGAALVTLVLPTPSGQVVGDVLALADTANAQVLVSGTASHARLFDGAGIWVGDATVGLNGSGADVEIADVRFFAGAFVFMSGATIR